MFFSSACRKFDLILRDDTDIEHPPWRETYWVIANERDVLERQRRARSLRFVDFLRLSSPCDAGESAAAAGAAAKNLRCHLAPRNCVWVGAGGRHRHHTIPG